jgi:hypothetical protein
MTSSSGPSSTNDKAGKAMLFLAATTILFLRSVAQLPESNRKCVIPAASCGLDAMPMRRAPRFAFASFSLHGANVPNRPPKEALRRLWDFVCTNCIKEVMQPARCVQTRMGQRVKGRHVSLSLQGQVGFEGNNMVRMGVEPRWLLGSVSNQRSRRG